MRGYAICTTQRSRSTLLCRLLAANGLGRPAEYFRTLDMQGGGFEDYPENPELQLRQALERGISENGVYGLKVMAWQARDVAPIAWEARLPALHFIHLVRADLLSQAISLVLARQTDVWESGMQPRAEPRYDADAVERTIREIADDHAAWRAWFGRRGIIPLELVDEDLIRWPATVVATITQLLCAPHREADLDLAAAAGARQHDRVNDEWRARFIEDRRDPFDRP